MRAVQLVAPGQPLELRELPDPEPGAREVVVRVEAAGICRSDVHYRAGYPDAGPLPMALGHEVAGVIEAAGDGVPPERVGERVCLHYQVSCGDCTWCVRGSEQFCPTGQMLGKSRPGGYAEHVVLPARNAFPLPEEIPFEHAAVMMCSSATSLHALRKGRLTPGESVAVFGVGGLGMSAIQIARAWGARTVYAVDVSPPKLDLAARLGAVPVDATTDAPADLRADVALELIGLRVTLRQAIECLRPMGRAVVVGLCGEPVQFRAYEELITREAEIIGSADHLAQELPTLLDMARRGALVLDEVVTDHVPLADGAVNEAMDRLESFGDAVRTVIVP